MLQEKDVGSVLHPGEILSDVLMARGILEIDFAAAAGIDTVELHDFLNGRIPVTLSLDRSLSCFFGLDIGMWIQLQYSYDMNIKA